MNIEIKKEKRYRRHKQIRAKIFGTAKVPRLCVFRSNKHIYTQLINDQNGKILVAVSNQALLTGRQELKSKISKTKKVQERDVKRTAKVAVAYQIGKLIAKKAKELKIEKVIFDRSGYKYHGRVRALAEGAREEGLKF